MVDKDEVIRGLKCCYITTSCDGCPYAERLSKVALKTPDNYCPILDDVLELLKEREPRVLTWEELEDWQDAVWFEDKNEDECYIALTANMGTHDATFVNAEPGIFRSFEFLRGFYNKEWRCWSARPTINQRRAVKWYAAD